MIFNSLTLAPTGTLSARAEGHPTEVVSAFHSAATLLLSERGPWRITKVEGRCEDGENLDSKMEWILEAKLKA